MNQLRRFIASKATKTTIIYTLPSLPGYEAAIVEKIGLERLNPNVKTDLVFNPENYQQVAKIRVPRGLSAMVKVTYHSSTCLGRMHHDIYPFFTRTYLIKEEQIVEVKKGGHGDE